MLGPPGRWHMSSSPVAIVWSARARCVGFTAILVGSLCACAPQPSPTGDDAPAPRAALPAAEAGSQVSPSAARPAESAARFAAVPCWFQVAAEREIDCGELTVPENWAKPQSKLIHLPVVIFRAAAAPEEPILFLNGGPGAPSSIRTAAEIRSWLGLLRTQRWTQRRDFIVLAQRGTNWTDSNLSCPRLNKLWRRDRFRQADQNRRREAKAATVACAQQLASAHDLSAYNTTQSARDIAALRQALGVEAWSVYAVSYGTRFALTLMKHHPAGLRSVVLDSVYPPGITNSLGFGLSAFSENLSAVLDTCARDPMCSRVYRDPAGSFAAAVDRLRRSSTTDADRAAGNRHVFNPAGLVDVIFTSMYSTSTIGLVPEIVSAVAEYPETYLNDWLSELFTEKRTTAEEDGAAAVVEGAFLAIRCNDDYAVADPAARAQAASAHPLFSEWLLDRERTLPCADWPVAAAPAEEKTRVASAIPTLLLVGAFDPATPPSYAEFAAATLARAHLFRFPGSGHGVLGSDGCASAITEAFLDDPETRPAATCLNAMRAVDFSPSFQMHALRLVAQGELAQAEQLLLQTLTYQKERLRPDHPGIAVTLSGLGECYHDQKRLTEAADVYARALAINGKVYGSDSREAGRSAGRLALVYDAQGRSQEASSMYRRTLRILERDYDQDHADVSFYRRKYRELTAMSAGEKP